MQETKKQAQELAFQYTKPGFQNADEKWSNRQALAVAWASLSACANPAKQQRSVRVEGPVGSLSPEQVAEGVLTGLQASGVK